MFMHAKGLEHMLACASGILIHPSNPMLLLGARLIACCSLQLATPAPIVRSATGIGCRLCSHSIHPDLG